MITFRINQQSQVGLRLDKFIVQQMPDYSRTRIQSWIKTKNVLVNGEGKKSGYALEFDDLVEVTIPESEPLEYELIPESLDLDILYEDDSIAVIDKPAGLVVHPGVGNQTGTLDEIVEYAEKKEKNGKIKTAKKPRARWQDALKAEFEEDDEEDKACLICSL